MIVMEEIQKLTRQTLGALTVLAGEDLGQYQLAKEALLQSIGYDSSDLTYSYFDMSEVDYAQVEMDLLSLPFFSDEKIVILDYLADLTTDKKRYLTDEALKQLEAYLEEPADTTRLVLLTAGKLDNKRRLVKLLRRDGLVLEATSVKEAELTAYFQAEIARRGLQLAPPVFEQVLLKSHYDFAETSKNLAFLEAYKGKEQIDMTDVSAALPKTLQDNLFDLTQLILAAKVEEARSLVADLRLQGEEEIKLVAILLNQFRIFLQVQILQAKGRGEAQIVSELSDYLGRKVNPYQVKFALRDSRHLSVSFLKKVVQLLIETDYQMKTGQGEKEYLLDVALLKIASL